MSAAGWVTSAARDSISASGKEREIHAIDRKTFEYHPAEKPRFASLETVRKIEASGASA